MRILLILFILLNIKLSCQVTNWKYVHHNKRLTILDSNITVKGEVMKVIKEVDGDYHIQLKLDSTFNYLLHQNNFKDQNGCLVIEIICAKKTILPFCACKGYTNKIIVPNVGDKIIINGPWVYDKIHEWNEIHPINNLEIIY
jgi:hypothetical protein